MKRFTVNLDDGLHARLDNLCRQDSVTKAELFRRALSLLYIVTRRHVIEKNASLSFFYEHNGSMEMFVLPYWDGLIKHTDPQTQNTQQNVDTY